MAEEIIKDRSKYNVYRKNLEDKIQLLRKVKPQERTKVLAQWWQENLKKNW